MSSLTKEMTVTEAQDYIAEREQRPVKIISRIHPNKELIEKVEGMEFRESQECDRETVKAMNQVWELMKPKVISLIKGNSE